MRSVVEVGASVPAFLGKLWKLVNDTETNHLISWSPGGKTFVIKNQAQFARELLPLYYKHNNMASFIRQLNMYGFHKITSVENGGLRYEKDEIEFSHPCFIKGHTYLLEHIKRKIANPKSIVTSNESGDKILLKPELMNKMLTDVKQMKGKQESLDAKFSAMKQENEALWREVAILRQKHIKQQQIVNNLIQFLMSLVQPARPSNASGNNVGVKRPYQLMINSAAHNSVSDGCPGRVKNMKLDKDVLMDDLNEDNMEDGPTIHELGYDDILHNEGTQDSMSETDFAIEIPTVYSATTNHSPTEPSTFIYQVTMEDGDNVEGGGQRVTYPISRNNGKQKTSESLPTVTSPSPTPTTPRCTLEQATMEQVANNVISTSETGNAESQVDKSKGRNTTSKNISRTDKSFLSHHNSYNALNPSADLKLPAEIFASDDSVSDVSVMATDDISVHNALQDLVQESLLTNTKDKMLGGINIKVENPTEIVNSNGKKSKKGNKNSDGNLNLANIKTELQDDFDWNNMILATVNNNSNVNRFQARNDIDDHLDTMQTDLESLRELLRSDGYAFDTNTLLGSADGRVIPAMSLAIPSSQPTKHLFGSEDPFYGLPYNTVDERGKTSSNNVEENQLISYTGNIPDFEDINVEDLECDNSRDGCGSPAPSSSGSTLNTPQMQVQSPYFVSKP